MKKNSLLHALLIVSLALLLVVNCAQAEVLDPTSAKNIPKPILMLVLYCHAALDTLQGEVEKSPPSVALTPQKQQAVGRAFQLNKLELGILTPETKLFQLFHKSVEDKAITAGEAQFLEKTARKDATFWFVLAKEKCKKEIFLSLSEEENNCLKNLNSEMHKCFVGFNERVETFMKLQK